MHLFDRDLDVIPFFDALNVSYFQRYSDSPITDHSYRRGMYCHRCHLLYDHVKSKQTNVKHRSSGSAPKKRLGFVPRLRCLALNSAGAAIPCSDANHVVYRRDEYFAISYIACFRSFQNREGNTLRVLCLDDHVNLRLGQEIEAVLAASIDFRNALLSALAFDVCNRHSRAELSHCMLYCIKFFPSYDRCDSFHTLTSKLFLALPAHGAWCWTNTFGPGHRVGLLFEAACAAQSP